MEFSPELLTTLVLAAISWTGVTFIAVIIGSIVFICISCSKRRRPKPIHPIKTLSRESSISIDDRPPSVLLIPTKTAIIPKKKPEQHKPRYDAMSVIDEHPYPYYNQKNKYKQQEYINDDTTSIINESRKMPQHHQRKQYPPKKPTSDVGLIDRHTPYPPDVIAREKFMYNIRFPEDD